MAGEIKLNGTTALTESGGAVTLNNVDSATNRINLGLGSAATSAVGDFATPTNLSDHAAVTSGVHGISAFGATLVNDADASTARTTLGLGSAATSASTDFVGTSRTITAGTGLSGGGDLSANRTIDVSFSANESNVKTALNASGSASIYACRAWINFNGQGTVTINSSGNIQGLADNGNSGDYTITFANAMPTATYAVVVEAGMTGISTPAGWGTAHRSYDGNEQSPTTTTCRIGSVGSTGGTRDTKRISAAIFC